MYEKKSKGGVVRTTFRVIDSEAEDLDVMAKQDWTQDVGTVQVAVEYDPSLSSGRKCVWLHCLLDCFWPVRQVLRQDIIVTSSLGIGEERFNEAAEHRDQVQKDITREMHLGPPPSAMFLVAVLVADSTEPATPGSSMVAVRL